MMTRGLIASGLVGIGGLVGSVARYGLSVAAQRLSFEWPLGTLAANVLGCFLIGAIAEISARGEALSPEIRLLLATGFCGGFTTMSSLMYETAQMLRTDEYLLAAFYFGLTLVLSMAAFFIGSMAVRMVVKTAGGLWN